jgi:hypothetical protein
MSSSGALVISSGRCTEAWVPHPFAPLAKGWVIALCATAILWPAASGWSQAAACGIATLPSGNASFYPPIAQAAHVTGPVVLLVSFDHQGRPHVTHVVAGPEMLQGGAVRFVEASRAPSSEGSRECPIVISFRLIGPPSAECGPAADESNVFGPRPEEVDSHHIVISRHSPCFSVTRDPAPWERHHFLFWHWYSRPA